MTDIFDVEYWWDGHAEVQCDFGGPVSPYSLYHHREMATGSSQSAPAPLVLKEGEVHITIFLDQ